MLLDWQLGPTRLMLKELKAIATITATVSFLALPAWSWLVIAGPKGIPVPVGTSSTLT